MPLCIETESQANGKTATEIDDLKHHLIHSEKMEFNSKGDLNNNDCNSTSLKMEKERMQAETYRREGMEAGRSLSKQDCNTSIKAHRNSQQVPQQQNTLSTNFITNCLPRGGQRGYIAEVKTNDLNNNNNNNDNENFHDDFDNNDDSSKLNNGETCDDLSLLREYNEKGKKIRSRCLPLQRKCIFHISSCQLQPVSISNSFND